MVTIVNVVAVSRLRRYPGRPFRRGPLSGRAAVTSRGPVGAAP